MRYYIIAGEASGDLHASNLMHSLKKADPVAQIRFIGGDLMASAGGTMLRHYKDLAYMGIWPVISHIGTILAAGKKCLDDIKEFDPDILILVDYPGFNLKIAELVKKANLRAAVYYYISPKLWAWKSYRIKYIKKYIDRLYSILPFETEYYEKQGYRAQYVGNPSVDSVTGFKKDATSDIGDGKDPRPVIALLAGSRKQEINRNLPVMLKVVKRYPEYRFILAGAPGLDSKFYKKKIGNSSVEIRFNETYRILQSAYAAIVTSGTAALETALFDVPQVVCYKMPFGHIVRMFRPLVVKCRYVTLVNLIDNSQIVPEIVAHVSAKGICRELTPLLDRESEERKAQLQGYERVKQALGPAGACSRATAEMLSALIELK